LLKISGEALEGVDSTFNLKTVDRVVEEVEQVHKLGIEIGIVVGGGNIIRGKELTSSGLERNQSDYIGMLATVINGLLLQSIFNRKGIRAVLQSALIVQNLTEGVVLEKTIRYLEEKKIVIFAGGTGSPFFTTDTAAALRACEIGADLLMKATKVEGVYDSDPLQNRNARLFSSLSYEEVLKRKLGVMDMTAVSMCRENKIPIIIFNLFNRGNILRIVRGEKVGTIIKE